MCPGMTARALTALGVLAALVVVTPASGKEGVVARVLTPISRDAAPGSKVNVVWTLAEVDGEGSRPFGGSAVFIRLFGPGGSHSKRVYGAEVASGRFRATVRIPRGGVRRVAIGLMGERCDAEGCRPSPILFRVVGSPLR
jgi:hypothetical protein